MRKWFIVGTQSITNEQEKSFITYIQSKGLGWWHWIPNFWLITGTSTECSEIRDELHKRTGTQDVLVVEVNPVTWAGYGPNTGEQNFFSWLNKTWSPTEEDKK